MAKEKMLLGLRESAAQRRKFSCSAEEISLPPWVVGNEEKMISSSGHCLETYSAYIFVIQSLSVAVAGSHFSQKIQRKRFIYIAILKFSVLCCRYKLQPAHP